MDNREDIYDDEQLESFKHIERLELIKALYEHCNHLYDVIASVRTEVNSLDYSYRYRRDKDMTTYQYPYPELYENITLDFSGYAAYEEFKSAFETDTENEENYEDDEKIIE